MATTTNRNRMVDLAQSLVGSDVPYRDHLFYNAYYANLKKSVETPTVRPDMLLLTYIMRMAGISTLVVPNAITGVTELRTWFQENGRYEENIPVDDLVVGSLVFYKNTVGVVTVHDGSRLSIVGNLTDKEGNSRVNLTSMSVHSNYIHGYGIPDYELKKTKTSFMKPTRLSSLVKPTYTVAFKNWLNETYDGINLEPTYVIRSATIRGIIDAWRMQMMHDRRITLDTATEEMFTYEDRKAALGRQLKTRSSGDMVKFLQYLLYAHGYDPKKTNGRFDADTRAALMDFQKSRKIDETGVTTPETWESLLTKW